MLSSLKVAKMCGFKSTSSLRSRVIKNQFTPPTIHATPKTGGKALFWSEEDAKKGLEILNKVRASELKLCLKGLSKAERMKAQAAKQNAMEAVRRNCTDVSGFNRAFKLMNRVVKL